jgi:hypothetical protein
MFIDILVYEYVEESEMKLNLNSQVPSPSSLWAFAAEFLSLLLRPPKLWRWTGLTRSHRTDTLPLTIMHSVTITAYLTQMKILLKNN